MRVELFEQGELKPGRRLQARVQRAPRGADRGGEEARTRIGQAGGSVRSIVDLEGHAEVAGDALPDLDTVDVGGVSRVS